MVIFDYDVYITRMLNIHKCRGIPFLLFCSNIIICFMKISNSSAIANIDFADNNKVLVQFTTNDTPYEFLAKDASLVRTGLESTINKGDSVGRLIASYRASGELTAV